MDTQHAIRGQRVLDNARHSHPCTFQTSMYLAKSMQLQLIFLA